MTSFAPGALDADDAEVERAMSVIGQLPPAQRAEVIRTAYRYIYAFRRTGNPDILIELANGAIGTVALRENPEYAQALDDLHTAIDATKGQPPVDVRQLLAAERERRAG